MKVHAFSHRWGKGAISAHPFLTYLANRLRMATHSSWSSKALAVLLSVDVVFIILHVLAEFTPLIGNDGFLLGKERGYPELFQYLKMLSLVLLVGALAGRKRAPLYFYWVLLFLYLLLDDSLQIHENLGHWLAVEFGLPGPLGLRPRDLGELVVAAVFGLFFLTTLATAYRLSGREARELSQSLVLWLVALAFFGVVMDVVQAMVTRWWLWRVLGVVEDGGEMVVVSLIAWTTFRRVEALDPAIAEGFKVKTREWGAVALRGAALLALFVAAMGFIQAGAAGLAGNDGYYHARMGLLMRQDGLKPAPPQLPLTILNEAEFTDHHLLYHAYLALFASVEPAVDGGVALTEGVKAASVLLAALAFVGIWWLLRGQRIRWASLWALGLLALSEAFLYRMSMPRAQAASLLVLVLGLHWLLQGRYRRLLPLGFIYVWLYNAFPLLLLLAGAYVAATAVSERRFRWPAIVYPAAGILLGVVVNPYFPQNVPFILSHLLPKAGALTTPVGIEWYPYETWTLVENSGLALGAFLLAALALGWREERMDGRTLTALLLTAVFGLMLFKSRRFVEYFPPFVLILTAFSVAPLLDSWVEKRAYLQRWLPVALALLLAWPVYSTLRMARESVSDSMPADQYRAAALWLKVYGEPGSTVFQTDWDDFPRLYFYDSDKVYTVGLDPTYMALHDGDLYAEWVQITRGEVVGPSAAIGGRFDADYVFSDREHEAFLERAEEDAGLEEVYRDEYAVIFRVVEIGD